MRGMGSIELLIAAILTLAIQASADVRLPAIFGNEMVIQRETEAPIWGWADPGERVAVEIPGAPVKLDTLEDAGMREKMRNRAKELLNLDTGIIVVAALPKTGLSTAWKTCLNATDRFMRDFVSLEEALERADIIFVGACHQEYRTIKTDKPVIDVFDFLPSPADQAELKAA